MGLANDSARSDAQEHLSSYFEKSASIVRQYADNFEHNYARPAMDYCIERFQAQPVTITFLTIFCVLSFLPVLSFIGISIFVVSFFTFTALACAFIASAIAETMFVAILVSTLGALFLVSILLTALALFSYLSLRLGVLVRADGRSGITEWAHETKKHFVQRTKRGEESDGSEASAVLVKPDEDRDHRIKVEDVRGDKN
ncbi:hypothetical protein BV22DRAFT_1195251 [Leucogyrophana mollusca]|uniref:Uncharacterized protein n=1 Tax=Leucogyrophana mollusca TaxID=85980 RepID=A0ACB8BJF4_9AGAM|nr:hypothetical protein BV22DRAFT_1195251 [Leucogyrophana mollusca]